MMKGNQNSLRLQLKETEDKASRLENYYVPKLQDTIKYQKTLAENIDQISSDAELLPSMFRAEAAFRIECKNQKDEALQKMKTFEKQHNKLVSERDDLKNELERKQRLAIQAIAARGNMKQHLDESKAAHE